MYDEKTQIFQFSTSHERVVEKVIQDENLHYIHMVFGKEEGLPEHHANATVYMTVIRGCLSIRLEDQPVLRVQAGSVLKIPFQTKMNVKNLDDAVLELLVVKSPAPKTI